MIDPRNVGARVKRLRESADLRQKDLAQRAGLSAGSVSMIENGAQTPDAAALSALAQVLDCSADYFTRDRGPSEATKPRLRAYADASKRLVDSYVADTLTAAEAILELQLRRIPDRLPTFLGDLGDDDDIEVFADEVRSVAGVGDGLPVGNATRAAERLGVVVLPMRSELGRHLGMSMRVDGIPIMRASRPSNDEDHPIPGDRQRFTLAHELGHLLLHANQDPPGSSGAAADSERQANRFASAFLAPAEPVLEDLRAVGGRPTLNNFAHLKDRWGFSIKGFVMRFAQLGVIEPDQARSLYKQISARRWNKHEPVPVGNESAQWLLKELKKIANPSPDVLGVAAVGAGIGASYFERWTDWSAPPTNGGGGALLDFPDAGSNSGSNEVPHPVRKATASVRRLPIR